MSQETISLVVPCYNEEATIEIFYHEVLKYEKQMPAQLEFCFVDDGSSDRTIAILRKLAAQDSRVHYVSFSRNFGKEAGLYAGLELATGDYVATMDVDLQDPPYLLPEMYRIVKEEGYDCVATKRSTRKGEPVVRSFFARMFYRIINRMSDTEIVDGARDYRFMSRQMVNAIIEDGEYNRFSKGIFSWVGFNTKWLSYENIERSAGQTKWSFWGLFKYSIEGILAYSTVPLYISSFIGVALFILSIIAFIFIIIKKLVWGDPVQGWASMVCILLFLGGIILLCLGIIGLYVSKIYLETKKRQIYIVKEKK
ncbi:glycosyl transferase family 2 [Intestinibaculum porci]|jgi:glycosyltransferase involved in cell wall biosynthesis|uniref:Glycosyl transferase family 2 n=1 Tax=Intestinibaculum porci TaxID=2487118 RepID=A0A3G9JWS0_9FIRM|nr:glycosyltransferase family 2 protein [Intestinibaculum porci]BBH27244.1 glycosyl transferase family 2 [Intestinibaculum porci]